MNQRISTPFQPPHQTGLSRSPEDRPAIDVAGEGRNVRRRSIPQQALLASIHETYGGKARQEPFTQCVIKPGASFRQLDAYLRELLSLDESHLSHFVVNQITAIGYYGEDFISFPSMGDSNERKSSSKVRSLMWSGGEGGKATKAEWHYDLGNTTTYVLKAAQLLSAEETADLAAPVQDRKPAQDDDDGDDDDEDAADDAPTFDDAYAGLTSQIVGLEGLIGIGKGCSPYDFAFCWNEGGPVSDVVSPSLDDRDPVGSAFRDMNRDALRMEGEVSGDESGDEGDGEGGGPGAASAFSFAERYPNVARFIAVDYRAGRRERWIELGTGRGAFIKAMKGGGAGGGVAVWQSPPRQRYGLSPHAALCALEKHLRRQRS